jgi:hypothetical protein
MAADFPFARSVVVVRSEVTIKKTGKKNRRNALLSVQRRARRAHAGTTAGFGARPLGRRGDPQSLAA